MTSYRWSELEEKGPPPDPKEKKRQARSFRLDRVILQFVGIAVLASLLLVLAFGAAGMAPRPLWFVAAALAIGFGALAIRLLVPQVLETAWPTRHDEQL